ncbi:cationic peroxidase 1-like [Gossypium australe]|uniref:peroxidase n=1 Tax=Gossypium australe TaxID=47621 RepID=A0A5B6UCL5_9ROSI|nr:cationic peroxidase 1-like [Gossypium australe]
MVSPTNFLLHAFLWLALAATSFSLSPNFYHNVCPQALPAIKRVVEAAVHKERRMGASLLRLHFHDCFVNGCDGSLLLDSTSFETEKNARGNLNSVRGFEVVDQIKAEVDRVCGRPVVSCADILAVAARDSVVALGGPTWKVRLGRRDSTAASRTLADSVLPSASMDLPALINNFKNQGLNKRDLVALSGGHTIGLSQCVIFRNRIYNATNIDPAFAKERRATCPRTGGNTNLAPFDPTPTRFDTAYFKNLVKERGLLTSDQALFSGGSTDKLVETYSKNPNAFWVDFGKSMIRMGNIKPLTGKQGQIRINCRKRIVEATVHREPRMGASLLRLHFHDCFVNGCDGSLLLDSTSAFETEKNARGNFNSVRGFEVVDQIKTEVDRVCGRPVVSCADILAVAARDSVLALGGPTWKVRLGRRDSTTASRALADSVLPSASMDLPALISNFKNQGLNTRDLVALSGGHTIGLSQCVIFRNRIYNATNIDPTFAKERRETCPRTGGNTNLAPFDPTPARFDTAYFKNLVKERGLLTSDQALFSGGSTDRDLQQES